MLHHPYVIYSADTISLDSDWSILCFMRGRPSLRSQKSHAIALNAYFRPHVFDIQYSNIVMTQLNMLCLGRLELSILLPRFGDWM